MEKKDHSLLKQIFVGVTISVVSAFLIFKFGLNKTQPVDTRGKDGEKITSVLVTQEPPPKSEFPLDIDWTNIGDFFVVKKSLLSKGFGRAPSQLQMVLAPKGVFSGVIQAFAFDQDGVRICPFSDLGLGMGCISYDLGVIFQSSMDQDPFNTYNLSDPRLHFWQKGVAERASIFVPHNAAKIQINFQQHY